MRPRLRYRGLALTPASSVSLLTARQLGLPAPLPRPLQDIAFLSRLACTATDVFPAIAADLTAPLLNPEPPTYCLAWCPVPGFRHLLAIANEDGRLAVQDCILPSPSTAPAGSPCHDNAVFDLAWSEVSADRLVTVAGDQQAALWDLAGGDTALVSRLAGHTRSVKCVDWRPGAGAEFATGARDNTVLVWDARSGTRGPENAVRGAHEAAGRIGAGRRKGSGAGPGVVTGLVWLDSHTLASAGDGDGRVKVWDLRKNYSLYRGEPLPRQELLHPGGSSTKGFTSLSLGPAAAQLFVSCMDDTVYRWDLGTEASLPSAAYTGASIQNFFTKAAVSPCGLYLASGSCGPDGEALLWHTASPGSPVARLTGHGAEVTCVAWSQDGSPALAPLATASDDLRHRVWRPSWQLLEPQELQGQVELMHKPGREPEPNRITDPPATPTRPATTTPSLTNWLTGTPTSQQRRGIKRRQCDYGKEESGRKAAKREGGVGTSLTSSISSMLNSPGPKCSFTPVSYRSPQKRVACSPVKTPRSPRLKLFSPLQERPTVPQSPTANLPSLAQDGRSPRNLTRSNRVKENLGTNWLTKYAKERKQGNSTTKQSTNSLPSSKGGFSELKTKQNPKKKFVLK